MNLLVSHWSANPVALTACAAVAGVHLAGLRRGAPGGPGSARAAACFYAGLLVALLAVVSPVGYWAQRYLWVRSVQDLLLANVAPGLVVLGAPWRPLARGLRLERFRPGAGRGRDPDAAPVPARDWPRRTLLVLAAYNVVWCGWHVPALYDATLTQPLLYGAQIVSYLGLGTALWLQLIGSAPLSPALTPLRRVMALTGTVVVGTVLGMILVFGSALVYTGYLRHQPTAAVLADQQVAGAVLWVLMLPSYTIAAVALLVQWLNHEEAEGLTSGLDRLLKPPKQAWPSRPGLGG